MSAATTSGSKRPSRREASTQLRTSSWPPRCAAAETLPQERQQDFDLLLGVAEEGANVPVSPQRGACKLDLVRLGHNFFLKPNNQYTPAGFGPALLCSPPRSWPRNAQRGEGDAAGGGRGSGGGRREGEAGGVAVVSGGGSGLGREIALELAQRGYALALLGRRAAALEATLGATGLRPERGLALPCDVRDAAAVEQ